MPLGHGVLSGAICGRHTGAAPSARGWGWDAALPTAPRSLPQRGQPWPKAGVHKWTQARAQAPGEAGVQVTMLMKLGLLSRPAMSKLPTPPVCGDEKSPGE